MVRSSSYGDLPFHTFFELLLCSREHHGTFNARYPQGYMLLDDAVYSNGTWMVRFNYSLPAWLREHDFEAMVKYYPIDSWNNVIAYIR